MVGDRSWPEGDHMWRTLVAICHADTTFNTVTNERHTDTTRYIYCCDATLLCRAELEEHDAGARIDCNMGQRCFSLSRYTTRGASL